MAMLRRIKNYTVYLYLFLFSIFLIKAPPFYYFPVPNKLFSSHTLAKLLILSVFYLLIFFNKIKPNLLLQKKSLTALLLFLFLLTQSLSIIKSKDIFLFWKSYHNIIFSIIIFILAYFFIWMRKENFQIVNDFIILSGSIFILFEFIFLFCGKYLLPFLTTFIQKEVVDAYQTNIARGRYTLELNLELFLPFFLIKYFSSPKKNFLIFICSFITIFLSIVSNSRSRVIMMLFVIISLFYLIKDRLSLVKKIIIFFSFGSVIFFSIRASNYFFRFNIIDRFLVTKDSIGTVNSDYRVSSINKSIELFRSSPLFGIGLGNYINYNNENRQYRYSFSLKPYEIAFADAVRYSPHNIFLQIISETGLFGLMSYMIIILHFMLRDYNALIIDKNNNILANILSSWTVFVYALFNPASSIFIIGWFWFQRGIIAAFYREDSRRYSRRA